MRRSELAQKGPGPRAPWTIRSTICRELGNRAPGCNCGGSENEGVGEHVRTRFHLGDRLPVKLRTSDPHRTKKTCFFCRTGFRKSELPERSIQPFDLMSRRHPLSSTRAAYLESAFRKQIVLKALVTCRHQTAGNFLEAKVTSSSWRPCGSSLQSSSLRSSPSSPS